MGTTRDNGVSEPHLPRTVQPPNPTNQGGLLAPAKDSNEALVPGSLPTPLTQACTALNEAITAGFGKDQVQCTWERQETPDTRPEGFQVGKCQLTNKILSQKDQQWETLKVKPPVKLFRSLNFQDHSSQFLFSEKMMVIRNN